MLANRRTIRETGRARYEIISMGTIRSNRTGGTPWGTKKPRNLGPCFTKPKSVDKINTDIARVPVTIICEVEVKDPGISPSRLQNKIK
jgi:hypothetical protein